jgi:hypothetical protein
VVRERVADDKSAVVVHEDAQVQAFLASLQEGEDVRLPQLVRRRALEAAWQVLTYRCRWRRLDESGLVQNPTYVGL